MTTITIINNSSEDCNVQSPLATKQDVLNIVNNIIMPKLSELTGILQGLSAQLTKAKTEILAEIQALEDSIKNNDPDISPESAQALSDLKDTTQTLDDLNVDAPSTEPTPGVPPAAALAQSRKKTL